MAKREFKVEGMSCQMCAKAVKQIFEEVEGVKHAEIVLEKELAEIEVDESRFNEQNLATYFKDSHYVLK